jgi:hypothetical protein
VGYRGKYTQVKEAMREFLRGKQEVFMPLIYQVEEEQVDFGYARAKVSRGSLFFYGTISINKWKIFALLHQPWN